MATLTVRQSRFRRNIYGNVPILVGGVEMPGLKEDAAQTYGIGAPLSTDATTGEVKIQANGDDVAKLWGWARKAASGVTGDPVLVQLYQPGDEFYMNLESNGAGAAANVGYIGATVNFSVVSGKLLCDVLPANAAAVGTKPHGTITDLYATDNGYPSADGVIADTNAQVLVVMKGGIGLGAGDT